MDDYDENRHHEKLVNGVDFQPTENGLLVACDNAGHIYVRQFRNGVYRKRHKAYRKAHASQIWSIRFSPDGTRLVTGSTDTFVKIWNIDDMTTPEFVLKGHESAVWNSAFSYDGSKVISCSADSTIRIWDAHTGALLRCIEIEKSLGGSLSCKGLKLQTPSDLSDLQIGILKDLGARVEETA